jgi:hypothetical protein
VVYYIKYNLFDGPCHLDNRSNSRASMCIKPRLPESILALGNRSKKEEGGTSLSLSIEIKVMVIVVYDRRFSSCSPYSQKLAYNRLVSGKQDHRSIT